MWLVDRAEWPKTFFKKVIDGFSEPAMFSIEPTHNAFATLTR